MTIMDRERTLFVECTPALRRQLEAIVEYLLAVLDTLDGDENLEDDDPAEDDGSAEPTLGAPERAGSWDRSAWARGGREDGEAEITTPTLDPRLSQDRYRPAGYDTPDDLEDGWDREDDSADMEDAGDDEPSLGALEIFCQTEWGLPCFGLDDEREHDADEEPDNDGFPEVCGQWAIEPAAARRLKTLGVFHGGRQLYIP